MVEIEVDLFKETWSPPNQTLALCSTGLVNAKRRF